MMTLTSAAACYVLLPLVRDHARVALRRPVLGAEVVVGAGRPQNG